MENYGSDKSVANPEDDKFQRAGFAKRIAETIINRKSADSLVIGMHGAWGEGKTSVVNFIQKYLSEDKGIVQVSFNPWRFTDESMLLRSFFNSVATQLQDAVESEDGTESKKSTKKKEPLKTKLESIGDIFSQYGKLVSVLGAGETAEALGKAFSDVSVDELKVRIEKRLEQHKKKIVVFIDDIDRLDKDEIYSIFRLVKLTGDFAYTTYVLSFDRNMVGAAIGARYGSGRESDGENFLEKIIQVPLVLPLAQKDALRKYCLGLVDNILNENQVTVGERSSGRFMRQFNDAFIPRLNTPRLAVRYANSLSFALPLLIGEVNIVDLLLLEGIRVFYPQAYELIKTYPELFTRPYTSTSMSVFTQDEPPEARKKRLESHLKEIQGNLGLSSPEIKKFNELLADLFPMLNSAFSNIVYGNNAQEDWYREKRICSNSYFNRYFSYAVLEGDLSDVAMLEVLDSLDDSNVEKSNSTIATLISKSNPSKFIGKLSSLEGKLEDNWEMQKKLCLALSRAGEFFPSEHVSYFGYWDTPSSSLAQFIVNCIKPHKNSKERFDIIKLLLETTQPFALAYNIYEQCESLNKHMSEQITSQKQMTECFRILRDRILLESDKLPYFEMFPDHFYSVSQTWGTIDRSNHVEYVKRFIEKDATYALTYLKASTNTIFISGVEGPHKGDFDEKSYNELKMVMDPLPLYEKVQKMYGLKFEKPEFILTFRKDVTQTDENIVQQFLYWYLKDISAA